MRGGFKITQCAEQHEPSTRSSDSNVPSWMAGLAAKAEEILAAEKQRKEAVTVVDHSRERQMSIHDQMYAIMNGKKPLYSSVEEAVSDYQKKTGLSDHLERIQSESSIKSAAAKILAASADEPEDSEKKNSEDRALVLDSHPNVSAYIDDVVKKNPRLSIPAILHMIAEDFSIDGVGSRELDDPNLARYINKALIEKAPRNREEYVPLGRDTDNSGFQEEDAFGLLRPTGK